MDKAINSGRRRFLSAAAMTLTAARLSAVSAERAPVASFGVLKQIDAGVLNIGYAEIGPTNGPAVVLLHGPLRKPSSTLMLTSLAKSQYDKPAPQNHLYYR